MFEQPLAWRQIKIAEICAIVAGYYHVSVEELAGSTQDHWISHARQHVYLLAYEKGKSSSEIGRVLRRDHTTVLWGKRAAQKRAEKDGMSARQLNELRALVDQKINQNGKDFADDLRKRNDTAVRD